MLEKEIKELLAAYGFEIAERNAAEHRIRFRGLGTFIDLWDGKRGMTIGIFNPRKGAMHYRRQLNWNTLEEELMKIKT